MYTSQATAIYVAPAYVLYALRFRFVCVLHNVIFNSQQTHIEKEKYSMHLGYVIRAARFYAGCGTCAANQISVFCSLLGKLCVIAVGYFPFSP